MWFLDPNKLKEIKEMILSFKRGSFWLNPISLSLVSVLSVLAFSENQSVFSQSFNKKPSVKSPQFMQQLKLTDAQQKQIMTIRSKYKNSLEQRREALKTTEEQLQRLMASSASVEVIQVKHTEFKRLMEEMENLRFNSMLEIREILTPSQRAQIAQLMNKHRQKFRQTSNRPPEF